MLLEFHICPHLTHMVMTQRVLSKSTVVTGVTARAEAQNKFQMQTGTEQVQTGVPEVFLNTHT